MKALVLIGNILFFSLRVIAQESVNQDTLFASFPEQVLKEVVVTPDLLERKADRIVFQVSPSDYGKNGEELLLQTLGIIFSDGMITINGTSGAKLFVNDREILLEDELLTAYLQSLHAEEISRIEVVPMSGAEQDAKLQGGVIHIWLRKKRENGLSASLAFQGTFAHHFQRYQPYCNWNQRIGKWEWYGNMSLSYRPEHRSVTEVHRDYLQIDRYFTDCIVSETPMDYESFRVGALYMPDDSNIWGVEGEWIRNSSQGRSNGHTVLSVYGDEWDSFGIYNLCQLYQQVTGNFSYSHRLDTEGSEWKLLAGFTYKDSETKNVSDICQIQKELLSVSDTLYRYKAGATYRIGTVDYSWKNCGNKGNVLTIGAKYTYTHMSDEAGYEGWQRLQKSWACLPDFAYGLNYTEHIAAIYGSCSAEWKRWSVKAGLRLEYTATHDASDKVRKHYLDWFPHLDITYGLNSIRSWMLVGQYARNIERPLFDALNPNRIQTSEYNYQLGNPVLKPTYIDRWSLTLVGNYRYTLTVGGNLHKNLIRQFSYQDVANPDVSYVTYENHRQENHWFVALNMPFQPFHWWNLSLNFVGVRQDIQMYEKDVFQTHYLYFGNVYTSFSLPAEFSLELRYSGVSRLYSGNSEVNPIHKVHLLLRKKIAGNRWRITLGVDNLFGRQMGYVGRLPDYTNYLSVDAAYAGRVFRVGIQWNLNKGKKFKKQVLERSDSSERSRLNENEQ